MRSPVPHTLNLTTATLPLLPSCLCESVSVALVLFVVHSTGWASSPGLVWRAGCSKDVIDIFCSFIILTRVANVLLTGGIFVCVPDSSSNAKKG